MSKALRYRVLLPEDRLLTVRPGAGHPGDGPMLKELAIRAMTKRIETYIRDHIEVVAQEAEVRSERD